MFSTSMMSIATLFQLSFIGTVQAGLCPTAAACAGVDPLTSSSIQIDTCALMYCNVSYSDSGIPCGAGTAGAAECDGVDPISFINGDFTQMEIQALVSDIMATKIKAGEPISPEVFANETSRVIEIVKDSTINVTFLTEGACFQVRLSLNLTLTTV